LPSAPTPRAGGGEHYYRSDSFQAWARVAFPSVLDQRRAEIQGAHDAGLGKAQAQDYVDHHYHQPSDELSAPRWILPAWPRWPAFGFALGSQSRIANRKWPAGSPGDEFEAARKKSEAVELMRRERVSQKFKRRLGELNALLAFLFSFLLFGDTAVTAQYTGPLPKRLWRPSRHE